MSRHSHDGRLVDLYHTNLLVNLYFFDAKLFRIRYYKRAHELILFWDAKLFHIW